MLLKQNIRVFVIMFVLLVTLWSWSFYSGILNLSLATNILCDNCLRVDFNTVNFLYGVILNKYTLCDLISSSKTFTCLSVHIEGYFSHSVLMTAFIVCVPICLILLFFYNVILTSVILSEHIILRGGIAQFSVYIFIYI